MALSQFFHLLKHVYSKCVSILLTIIIEYILLLYVHINNRKYFISYDFWSKRSGQFIFVDFYQFPDGGSKYIIKHCTSFFFLLESSRKHEPLQSCFNMSEHVRHYWHTYEFLLVTCITIPGHITLFFSYVPSSRSLVCNTIFTSCFLFQMRPLLFISPFDQISQPLQFPVSYFTLWYSLFFPLIKFFYFFFFTQT